MSRLDNRMPVWLGHRQSVGQYDQRLYYIFFSHWHYCCYYTETYVLTSGRTSALVFYLARGNVWALKWGRAPNITRHHLIVSWRDCHVHQCMYHNYVYSHIAHPLQECVVLWHWTHVQDSLIWSASGGIAASSWCADVVDDCAVDQDTSPGTTTAIVQGQLRCILAPRVYTLPLVRAIGRTMVQGKNYGPQITVKRISTRSVIMSLFTSFCFITCCQHLLATAKPSVCPSYSETIGFYPIRDFEFFYAKFHFRGGVEWDCAYSKKIKQRI